MHQELLRQAKMVEKAEKYENERDKVLSDNRELHNQVDNINAEYKEKEFDIEWKYKIAWCNYSIDFLVKIIYNGNIKFADCKFWI